MNMCTGTFRRSLLAAVTAMCTTGIVSLANAGQSETLEDLTRVQYAGPVPGGIAGVAFSENFEANFTLGQGCGQNGWLCGAGNGFQIVDFNPPQATFGNFSAQGTADSALGGGSIDMASALFPLQTGATYADIVITNSTSIWRWDTVSISAGNTVNFFSGRVQFEVSGLISVLQIDTNVGPNCASGTVTSFHVTSGTWAPNVLMRIGIEVLNAGANNQRLKVYKNGTLIFTGHDVSQECTAGGNPIGISRVQNFNSNTGTTSTMTVDNISETATVNPCSFPLPLCRGDIDPPGGNGTVGLGDLLKVIGTWNQTQVPPGTGPRPVGDTHPLPNGDCVVNLQDLLAVIGQWGACPVVTGACCIQGVCSIKSQPVCVGSPNFGTYQGNNTICASVVCPVTPANDLCANASTAITGNGSYAWNNANANFDGGAVVASCLPALGGGRGDVWFKYTASCSGNLSLDTLGTAAPFTDTILQVFDTWNCNPLGTLLGCNDDIDFEGDQLLSDMTIQVTSGQQMLIRCMSQSASPITNSGLAVLNVDCSNFNNDLCTDATPITLNSTIDGTLVGTTGEQAPNCLPIGGTMGTGRWYTIVGTGQTYKASTCSSTPAAQDEYDGQLAVYCGLDCSEFTCIGGSFDLDCGPGGLGTGKHEEVTWCAATGKKYFIWVGGDQIPFDPNATYKLVVTATGAPGSQSCAGQVCGLTPQNDLCVNAAAIANGTKSFSTLFAHTDGNATPTTICNDTSPANDTVQDVWYRYTATCTGTLTVTTCNDSGLGGFANYDSDIVIYPGTEDCPPPGESAIGCNDDDGAHACGSGPVLWMSTARASVVNGQSYIIRVGGWANTTDVGTGVLSVSCTVAVCGNGTIELGEECDDGNTTPGDGCDANCDVEPVCSTTCVFNSFEPCAEGDDTWDGGCNFTPPTFQDIPLFSGTTVVCGNLWANNNTRDLDWYTVTVGPSGVVSASLTGPTVMSLLLLVGTGDTTDCDPQGFLDSAIVNQGECGGAVAAGLTPGTKAIVAITTNGFFSGFPCNLGPWTYSVRIQSQ